MDKFSTERAIASLSDEDRKSYISYYSNFGKVGLALGSKGKNGACKEITSLVKVYESFAFSKDEAKVQLSVGMIGCLDNLLGALELNREDCK